MDVQSGNSVTGLSGRINRPSPPYHCPHEPCSKTFLRREHLTRHEQSHHSSLKPHKCHLCSKAFARSDILKRHVALHSSTVISTKRTLVACGYCRRRKLKCDVGMPCRTCVERGVECERDGEGMDDGFQTRRQTQVASAEMRHAGGEEKIEKQCQGEGVCEVADDAGVVEMEISMMELSLENFGEKGWCPGRSARERWQTFVT